MKSWWNFLDAVIVPPVHFRSWPGPVASLHRPPSRSLDAADSSESPWTGKIPPNGDPESSLVGGREHEVGLAAVHLEPILQIEHEAKIDVGREDLLPPFPPGIGRVQILRGVVRDLELQ